MLIFNMGIPRSGTTLVLNVLRGIHEKMARKCRVLNPGTGAEVDTAIDTEQQNENLILHCHVITDKVIERSRRPGCAAIFNIRDPRDVVVSQMKLHDVGLESAIQMTVAAFGSLEAATRIPKPDDHPILAYNRSCGCIDFPDRYEVRQISDAQ